MTHSLTETPNRESNPLREDFAAIRDYLQAEVLGQPDLVEKLLIALLADGHLLVEGAPGLAKTSAVRALGDCIEAEFQRISFTPDLLPADLTGTEIYRPAEGRFEFHHGPLFHSLVLADEINRAPAKVQSALLEAMSERRITVGRVTYRLPDLFMVMATQNPIEQEGTFPLPEAQLDRFLLFVRIGFPDPAVEREILRLARGRARRELVAESAPPPKRLSAEAIRRARREVLDLHVADPVEQYLLELIRATREPTRVVPALAGVVAYGASPRGAIGLDRAARARAWLAGRDYVIPADIQALAPDVLRHRMILSYESEARGLSSDEVLRQLLAALPSP